MSSAFLSNFSIFDGISLTLFYVAWVGYTYVADHSRYAKDSVPAFVDRERRRWMNAMLDREMRMVDTLIVGNLVRGIAFFASTAILLVGGLLAMIGSTDAAIRTFQDLPFTGVVTRLDWEVRVFFLATIFIYAFVKFVWAFRLANYTSILIGSAPTLVESAETRDQFASQISRLSQLTGRHFNRGLRANFFALAALGWFLHWGIFMMATLWVVYVLYRREFKSEALEALRKLPPLD